MNKEKYFKNLQDSLSDGKISEDAFWAGIENAEIFCDSNEDDEK